MLSTGYPRSGLSDRARAFSVSSLVGSSPLCSGNESLNDVVNLQCAGQLNDGLDVQDSNNISCQSVTAELLCRELWLEFHTLGTEMIITKAGRRMFPSLKVRLCGLKEDELYIVYVEMDPVDDKRYRYIYQSSKWIPGGPGDVPHQERRFLHPDGPQLGKFWNRQSCVAFDKLKLTNSRKPSQRDQIPLHSMHRYQPKLYIQSIPNDYQDALMNSTEWWRTFCRRSNSTASFEFLETQFITVTAYQNQQITRLKIASNPFAKGFRESNRETRNFEVSEDEEAPSNKKLRGTSFCNKSGSTFPLVDINYWNAFHPNALVPVHHWWIQQYSLLNPTFHVMSSIPVPHDQTEEPL